MYDFSVTATLEWLSPNDLFTRLMLSSPPGWTAFSACSWRREGRDPPLKLPSASHEFHGFSCKETGGPGFDSFFCFLLFCKGRQMDRAEIESKRKKEKSIPSAGSSSSQSWDRSHSISDLPCWVAGTPVSESTTCRLLGSVLTGI